MAPLSDSELVRLVRQIADNCLRDEGWYTQAERVQQLCDRFEAEFIADLAKTIET